MISVQDKHLEEHKLLHLRIIIGRVINLELFTHVHHAY